ncbi:MAG: alpha/beta hydrolase [Gammaproteobacteria bacterium]|nr:alpha/beta hydrolase [Gammaproteobacteria bacterium]
MFTKITDWDDAYANGAYIEAAEDYPAAWARAAQEFRQQMTAAGLAEIDIAYASGERQRLDMFRPQAESRGLVVFIHGGYWRAFDKSFWSHLAAAATQSGWTVAMPSYELAPTVSISEISRQMGTAIDKAASLVDGPIRLSGHSAGGHLVTRMICQDSPLATDVTKRIERVVSISGLHDLRPLLKTAMNDDFRMDESEAEAESSALNRPIDNVELVCWVGADERPEFIRQSELLANIWTGFGIKSSVRRAKGQHHFNVIDGLADTDSALARALLK